MFIQLVLKHRTLCCLVSIYINEPSSLPPSTPSKTQWKLKLPRAVRKLSQSHSHKSITCFSGAIWWPISVFLHHIPESWPHLWKLPSGPYQHSAHGEWGDSMRQRSCSGFEWVTLQACVSAHLQGCLSTELEADLVCNCCWWMSWDGVCPKSSAYGKEEGQIVIRGGKTHI